MSARVTDIRELIENQKEAFEAFISRYDEKFAAKNTEIAALRERLEELETRASSPGRTGALSHKAREHKQLFEAWIRKPSDASRMQTLANFEAVEFKDVTVGTGAAGGFAVPEEISRQIGLLERKF